MEGNIVNKNILFLIFFTSLFCSLLFNELNLAYVKQINPTNYLYNTKSTVYGHTLWSIDNSWYLPFVENMMNGNGYTLDPNEPEMKVRRTPGYPMYYAIFYYLFGEQRAHFLIKYFQILLFALSSVLVALSVKNIFNSNNWAVIAGFVYAVNPFIYSYCFFTLTESISPFTVTIAIYFFSLYITRRHLKLLAFCAILSAISFLTRPMSGILITGFIAYLLFDENLRKSTIKVFMFISIFVLALSPWIIRNYLVTGGELIIAEKFYHGSPMSFGKSHVSLRYLVSCWTNPANISTELFSNELRKNIREGNQYKNEEVIDNYINEWPDLAFKGYNRTDLKKALHKLDEHYANQFQYRTIYPNALRVDFLNIPSEHETSKELNLLRHSFIGAAPLRYYIITPIITGKEIIFNSFLHHIALINPLDGKLSTIQFLAKSMVYLLHASFYLSLLYLLIFFRIDLKGKLFILVPIVGLMFSLTLLLFRYVEVRYLLPIYPLLVISFSFMIHDISSRIKKFRK